MQQNHQFTEVQPVLSVRNLSKSFSGRTVVNNVTFDLRPGEALALVGENGAGKTTTKNMLCGLLEPGEGTILVRGKEVPGPERAAHGVSAVHQELSLFGSLTVAENICISDLPGKAARIDWRETNKVAQQQLDILGMSIDPSDLVETLGAGHQQVVEIAKALLHANRVLILDEPTTSLTVLEREKLFEIVDSLKAQGLAIVFISHFMEEIYRLCDTFIVLRDGHQVGHGKLNEVSQRNLEEMMVGRALQDAQLELADRQSDEVLRVKSLNSPDFDDINFSLKKGEILGISGLMGAGRTELAEAIFGLRPSRGSVQIMGREMSPTSIKDMKKAGVCYVPEDRRRHGMFLNRPVRENLSASALAEFVKRTVKGIGFRGERLKANSVVDEMSISVPHVESQIGDLSGGNQQKVLLGRWLAMNPDILIFDEPTKGVDIGAKFDIHQSIIDLAESGRSVIIVSSDLPELLHTTHRMLVMRKGRIAGSFERAEYDPVKIISLAASEGLPHELGDKV
ncbi:sugar ABC transporter ATP-binding protein [Falsihalocynthiibacter sp. SS001]|uniref:sugar ABC transporter ATP-binding protein n=1 Tax=Falsihalocynthiibacter sp. SS001 TaxID=3349698 RepID=UPI0036D3E236